MDMPSEPARIAGYLVGRVETILRMRCTDSELLPVFRGIARACNPNHGMGDYLYAMADSYRWQVCIYMCLCILLLPSRVFR